MIKVGLTGNYFSGYDEVATIFEKLGVKVFDADLMIRYFVNFSQDHINRIKKQFGNDSYNLGTLNIDKFRNKDRLEDLLDIIEFDILISYARFRLLTKGHPYTLFKYSYIFERGLESDMDFIVNSSRSKTSRENDMKDFTKIPSIAIVNILNGEMSQSEKNKSSSFVIRNNDPLYKERPLDRWSEVWEQVEKVHQTLSKKIPQETLGD